MPAKSDSYDLYSCSILSTRVTYDKGNANYKHSNMAYFIWARNPQEAKGIAIELAAAAKPPENYWHNHIDVYRLSDASLELAQEHGMTRAALIELVGTLLFWEDFNATQEDI